jgi:hypothetical protein
MLQNIFRVRVLVSDISTEARKYMVLRCSFARSSDPVYHNDPLCSWVSDVSQVARVQKEPLYFQRKVPRLILIDLCLSQGVALPARFWVELVLAARARLSAKSLRSFLRSAAWARRCRVTVPFSNPLFCSWIVLLLDVDKQRLDTVLKR